MSLNLSNGQIETRDYETALDRIISAVNFVDPGLDFFEIYVWIDLPEKDFPGVLPLSHACCTRGGFQPYYHIKKGQNLFTAKLVEESYGPEAVRKSDRAYGILVKYTPESGLHGAVSEGAGASRPSRLPWRTGRRSISSRTYLRLAVRHCFLDQGSIPGSAFLATIDELIPNLRMPRWTIDRVPPNGILVDFPDEADERLRNEVFSVRGEDLARVAQTHARLRLEQSSRGRPGFVPGMADGVLRITDLFRQQPVRQQAHRAARGVHAPPDAARLAQQRALQVLRSQEGRAFRQNRGQRFRLGRTGRRRT